MSLHRIIRSLSASLPRCQRLFQSENVSRITRTSVAFQQNTFKPQIQPAASFCATASESRAVYCKLTGAPFQSRQKDIEEFLQDIQVQDVIFEYHYDNRPSGRVFVQVAEGDVEYVKRKHGDYIQNRYIEVEEVDELLEKKISDMKESQRNLVASLGNSSYLQLLGLPFQAGADEVRAFFKDIDIEEVLFEYIGSRKSGRAFVQVSNDDVSKALDKDKEYIGERYVNVRPIRDDMRVFQRIKELQRMNKKIEDVQRTYREGDLTYISLKGVPLPVNCDDVKNFLRVPVSEVLVNDDTTVRQNFVYCLIKREDLNNVLQRHGSYMGANYIIVHQTPENFLPFVALSRQLQ